MIDNVTLEWHGIPPQIPRWGQIERFDYRGVTYSPFYKSGQIHCYKGELGNLRISLFREKAFLANSLHKFYHKNNYTDFYLYELRLAFERLCSITGVNWKEAIIKRVEYGCNIFAPAESIYQSLACYKINNFYPMVSQNGRVYGARCIYEDYIIKGYDKALQTKLFNKVFIDMPLLRWEIQVRKNRYLERINQSGPITANYLLKEDFLSLLSNDALSIYENSFKMEKLRIEKLGCTEKKIVACMLNPEIRESLRIYNSSTYKKNLQIFNKIITDPKYRKDDPAEKLLEEKFKQLIYEKP